jgi:hypothetical protein
MREKKSTKDAHLTPLPSAPPSSALLRTCQRLHTETKGIFMRLYAHYWQKTFTIDLEKTPGSLKNVYNCPAHLIDRFLITILRPDCVRRPFHQTSFSIAGPVEFCLWRPRGQWRADMRPSPRGNGFEEGKDCRYVVGATVTFMNFLARYENCSGHCTICCGRHKRLEEPTTMSTLEEADRALKPGRDAPLSSADLIAFLGCSSEM